MALSPWVQSLVRKEVASLEPYDPAFTPCDVNLSANENTWPQSEAFRQDLDLALSQVQIHRYPDPLAHNLRNFLAQWLGMAPEAVIVGNGGDELLFNLFLAFGGPGKTLVNLPPTFSVYELYSQLLGTQVVNVWRDPETFTPLWDQTLNAAATADIVVVTSPNNPTGDLAPLDRIRELCECCPGVVMVDEAYGEFASPDSSAIPLLERYPRLMVLKTLSKAFGLAGVRLGYVAASPEIIDVFAAVRQPYSVNSFSQAAAQVALSHKGELLKTVASICQERASLAQQLRALGCEVWDSEANFLMVRLRHAHQIRQALIDRYSILVRDFSHSPGLRDCLRITVGTPEENRSVIKAFRELLSQGTYS